MCVNTLSLEIRNDALDEITDVVDGHAVSSILICEFVS